MPSNPPKVRPLSEFGVPRGANPSKVADAAGKAAKASKVLGPEVSVPAEVIVRKRNKTLKEQAANQAKKGLVKGAGRSIGSQGALVAEFLACMLILLLSPLGKDVSAKDFMRKGTAVSLLFIVLAMIGSAGPGARRAVTAFGGLLTLVVFLDQRNLLLTISGKFGSKSIEDAAVRAGAQSAAQGGKPVIIQTPQGPQTITVVPGPNGSWIAGNSVDF